MTMTAEEIKTLGDSEMETGRSVAIALGIVSIAFLLIIGAFSFAVVPNLLPVVALLVVSLGAAAVTGAMFWAWRRRNQIIALFMRYKLPAPLPAPPANSAPALPPALETGTEASRGGEGARKIHGFDAATIMWVCDCLANGMPWTEAHLETMTVPHMQPPTPFGKSQVGKPYYRLFHHEHGIFCRAEIITGRGGPGNPTGKLMVKSPLGMLERIKNLPEDTPTP
jgi:hypothetical protein